MVIFAGADAGESILADIQGFSQTTNAAVIGEVISEPAGMVLMTTELGAQRILGMLEGEHVPRIC
ncbi:MAG: hypothetical protein GX825_07530 [Syntrophomonadaceae bacterium]|nr:hypothetical protein [Syntrophomonadaceae bacterium]